MHEPDQEAINRDCYVHLPRIVAISDGGFETAGDAIEMKTDRTVEMTMRCGISAASEHYDLGSEVWRILCPVSNAEPRIVAHGSVENRLRCGPEELKPLVIIRTIQLCARNISAPTLAQS